jgi:hypothetical protein
MARTLSTFNSVLTLTVSTLDIGPIQIQGFATDDAFDAPDVKPVEVMIGVDGQKSSGYVAYLVPFKFTLQATSTSIDVMDAIQEGINALGDDVAIGMSLESPALGKLWTGTNGSLTSYKPTPQGKKLLGPQSYEITFEQLISSVI